MQHCEYSKVFLHILSFKMTCKQIIAVWNKSDTNDYEEVTNRNVSLAFR